MDDEWPWVALRRPDGTYVDVTPPGYGGLDVDEDERVIGTRWGMAGEPDRAFLAEDGRIVELPVPPGLLASWASFFTPDGAVRGVLYHDDGSWEQVEWLAPDAMPTPPRDPCAGSRQVHLTDHLPAAWRDRWPLAYGTVVLDTCPPPDPRTARGRPAWVSGGTSGGVHVGYGRRGTSGWVDAVAWVHGLPLPLRPLDVPQGTGAEAYAVNDDGLVVGAQTYRPGQDQILGRRTAVAWRLPPALLGR